MTTAAAPPPSNTPEWAKARPSNRQPDWFDKANLLTTLPPEVAQSIAEAERVEAVAELQRREAKTEETRLKRDELQLKREMVKKGLGIEEVPGGPRSLVGRALGSVQMRAIDWLWTGWIPKGYITLMAGETGAGKSTVLADVTARVTTGASWPGEYHPREPGSR